MGEMSWAAALLGYESVEAARRDEEIQSPGEGGETYLVRLTYVHGAAVDE